MRFLPCTANGDDHDSGRAVCSGIAATTPRRYAAVSGLVTSCPCWPCGAPSMAVAWAGGGGSWSAPFPGSTSSGACASATTSAPTSTKRSSRSVARWFAGSRCARRGGPPEGDALSPTPHRQVAVFLRYRVRAPTRGFRGLEPDYQSLRRYSGLVGIRPVFTAGTVLGTCGGRSVALEQPLFVRFETWAPSSFRGGNKSELRHRR
jgi:hypothetical protein